jgi:hypothetical protein
VLNDRPNRTPMNAKLVQACENVHRLTAPRLPLVYIRCVNLCIIGTKKLNTSQAFHHPRQGMSIQHSHHKS